MTVSNGCTEAEAKSAAEIADRLIEKYKIEIGGASAVVDQPLTAKRSAIEVGLSLPAFWKAVAAGRLPQPVYPLPRAPRWFRSELREAMLATRSIPREQMARRRAAKITELPAA